MGLAQPTPPRIPGKKIAWALRSGRSFWARQHGGGFPRVFFYRRDFLVGKILWEICKLPSDLLARLRKSHGLNIQEAIQKLTWFWGNVMSVGWTPLFFNKQIIYNDLFFRLVDIFSDLSSEFPIIIWIFLVAFKPGKLRSFGALWSFCWVSKKLGLYLDFPEAKLLFIFINFTPKTSHSYLVKMVH